MLIAKADLIKRSLRIALLNFSPDDFLSRPLYILAIMLIDYLLLMDYNVTMRKLISLILLISYPVTAQVVYLEKDKPAPYTGYLFTPEKELDTRTKLLDLDYYKALDDSNKRLIVLYGDETKIMNDQLANYKQANDELFKKAQANSGSGFWTSFLYFGLGCLVTTAVTYSVRK